MNNEPKFEGEGFTSQSIFKEPQVSPDNRLEAIRVELRSLAESDPDELKLKLAIVDINEKYCRIGKKTLEKEYQQIRDEIEEERRPPQPPPSVPSKDELEQQEAEELARRQWDEAVNKRAKEIAEAPDIIESFKNVLHEHKGYIADYTTIGTIIVSHHARLLSSSNGFLWDGASASGKSKLVNLAAEFLPPEDIIFATSCSNHAFDYIGDVSGKYIIGGELKLLKPGEDDPWQQGFRQLISENMIIRLVVEKDENGNPVLVSRKSNGPAVFTMTTTAEATSFNDEFINRLSIAHTNDSELMTEKVLIEQARKAKSIPDATKERKTILEIEAWRQYHRNIKKLEVVIPFADEIILTTRAVTARRLLPLIFDYIRALALAHQANREINIQSGYTLANVADYKITYKLITANAPRVSDPVADRGRQFYEKLKMQFPKPMEFTRAQVQRKMNISQAQAGRFLRDLRDAGCISPIENKEGKAGKAYIYKIADELPDSQDFGLIHPDRLTCSSAQPAQSTPEQVNPSPVAAYAPPAQLITKNRVEEKNICVEI